MVSVKITKKRIYFSLIFVLFVSVIIFYIIYVPKPLTSWNYYGNMIYFRADLREAQKIPVKPSETALYTEINSQLIQNITILFKPTASEGNAIYIPQEFQIVQALTMLFKRNQVSATFNANATDSYENIYGKIQNPIIVLIHPDYANETSVKVSPYHVIYISGKTDRELDLATTKFLMVALGITL